MTDQITAAQYRKGIPGTKANGFKAAGRLKPGQMNKTEKRYLDEIITPKVISGEIVWWAFDSIKFRLGEKCFYEVDFIILTKEMQLEVHEVKGGFIMDDALVKLKVAAEYFPFQFIMAKYDKKQWQIKEF